MWEYKILQSDIGYKIYKKKECDWIMSMWFLWPENKWVLNTNCWKLYYHKEDALAALTLARFTDRKENVEEETD